MRRLLFATLLTTSLLASSAFAANPLLQVQDLAPGHGATVRPHSVALAHIDVESGPGFPVEANEVAYELGGNHGYSAERGAEEAMVGMKGGGKRMAVVQDASGVVSRIKITLIDTARTIDDLARRNGDFAIANPPEGEAYAAAPKPAPAPHSDFMDFAEQHQVKAPVPAPSYSVPVSPRDTMPSPLPEPPSYNTPQSAPSYVPPSEQPEMQNNSMFSDGPSLREVAPPPPPAQDTSEFFNRGGSSEFYNQGGASEFYNNGGTTEFNNHNENSDFQHTGNPGE